MIIDFRTRGFSLTPGLRGYGERRLELALDRHRERVARVRVTLSDVNGPKGGVDKCCRVEVRLRDGRSVRVTVVDADLYAALGTAAHRAGRALARALARERATTLELLWLARTMAAETPASA